MTEIADHLGLNKSTVHRILITLADRGAIEQRENRKYSVGLEIFELGNVYRLQADLTSLAEPVMKRLAQQVRLTVRLGKVENGKAYDLMKVDSPEALAIYINPALGREVSCSSVGKVFLSELTEQEIAACIEQYGLPQRTRRSIVRFEDLRTELQKVRKQGYAVNNQEFVDWLRGVAAPVYDDSGKIAAAVCVSGTLPQIPLRRIPLLGQEVRQAASEISHELGWKASGL